MLTRMKAIRLSKGISQSVISKEIGINRTWYNLVENGRYNPTERTLELIEAYFGEPIDKLISKCEIK